MSVDKCTFVIRINMTACVDQPHFTLLASISSNESVYPTEFPFHKLNIKVLVFLSLISQCKQQAGLSAAVIETFGQ